MNAPIYINENNNSSSTFFYREIEIKKIEDDGSTVADESSTVYDEDNLRAAKGIVFAQILCIPFWLLFIMLVVWFYKN